MTESLSATQRSLENLRLNRYDRGTVQITDSTAQSAPQLPPLHAANRVGLDHPDYRYGKSRNPYQDKVRTLEGRVFSDNDSESHRGEWRAQFPDAIQGASQATSKSGALPSSKRPLHVEIGCNAGHVTVEWAARDPQAAFIGIDWKFKPIFRAAEKGVKRGIDNLVFLRAHADRIGYMFGPGEIDFLALYFPDPWPKKAQLKNRWLTAERLRTVAQLVRSGGIFHIKTDHLGYFEAMEEAIAQVQAEGLWEPYEHTRDLHAGHPAPQSLKIPEITLFEGLFIKDGIKINSVKLRRK